MKIRAILILFIFLSVFEPCFASSDNLLEFDSSNVPVSDIKPKSNGGGVFSLTTIMDNILNYENDAPEEDLEENERQRKTYVGAMKKFSQGNVVVAYDEFDSLSDSISSDFALLVFSKSMYEIGFFSIGSKCLAKIKHKNYLNEQINDLKKSYLPSLLPDKNQEIYLAKVYTSVYFDNSAQESVWELNQKSLLVEKSDYANFILSQAFLSINQYQQALTYINKAVAANPKNACYVLFKARILNGLKKYKEALLVIENYEKTTKTLALDNDFLVQKQAVLANIAKNDNEKKFYLTNKTFIEGNLGKTIKDAENILSFDKNNYKIISLLASAQFIEGDRENAAKNYLKSYEINKNYVPTLIGLGDVAFSNYDLENALKYYKKAYSTDEKNQESALKIALIYKNEPKYAKELKKIEKKLDKMDLEPYMIYHQMSVVTSKSNPKLTQSYINRAIAINPLYENLWVDFINFEIENNRLDIAKNFLYMISFTNRSNYIYYYLNGIYNIALGNKNEAIVNFKNCLSLKPDFVDANKKLLEILPSRIEEYDNFEETTRPRKNLNLDVL